MTNPFAVLATRFELPCGVELPNRIVKAATSEALATDHMFPTPEHAALYRRWSAGGAGLLVTGNVMVDRRRRVARGDVALAAGDHLGPFENWVRAVVAPSKLWMQLGHPGRQSPRALDPEPVAPSYVPLGRAALFASPRALDGCEVEALVSRFALTAGLAKQAGFHGVQLHAAHGYLIHQFLSVRTNRREDAWGGSPAGRRRFLLSVLRGVRDEVGYGFPIGVKLDTSDTKLGPRAAAERLDLVKALADEGADLLELTGGSYETHVLFGRRATRRPPAQEALFADFAEQVRRKTGLPLVLTGGLSSVSGMVHVVSSGLADLVGLARALIHDPDLPSTLLAGSRVPAYRGPRRLGLRSLDSAMELAWYTEQVRRLASGRSVDHGLRRSTALFEGLRALLR